MKKGFHCFHWTLCSDLFIEYNKEFRLGIPNRNSLDCSKIQQQLRAMRTVDWGPFSFINVKNSEIRVYLCFNFPSEYFNQGGAIHVSWFYLSFISYQTNFDEAYQASRRHLIDSCRSMVMHSSHINSQAAVMHKYLGLHPVAEFMPEVKTCHVNMMRKCPIIIKCRL